MRCAWRLAALALAGALAACAGPQPPPAAGTAGAHVATIPCALPDAPADRCGLWRAEQACKAQPAGTGCVYVPVGREPKTHLIIKDNSPAKPDGYLLVPYAAITGVESPALQRPGMPDYFAEAWDWAAADLSARVGEPIAPERTALAINSVDARTQDQLHIHISCAREDVVAALDAARPRMGDDWATAAPVRMVGQDWSVIRLEADDLTAHDPFATLHAWVRPRGETMAEQTVAVIGDGRDRVEGFYVIDGDGAEGGPDASEDLLDQACRAERTAAGPSPHAAGGSGG